MTTPAEEASRQEPSAERPGRGRRRPGVQIRTRLVALVVVSALLPALLVGWASYLTASKILLEKVNRQLSGRVASAVQRVELWLGERAEDAHIFASSFIVTENLDLWRRAQQSGDPIAAAARTRVEQYLAQVRERDPDCLELAIVDASGEVVAHTEPAGWAPSSECAAELAGEEGQVVRVHGGGQAIVHSRASIRLENGEAIGALVTGASMETLWRHLAAGQESDAEHLAVIDAGGQVLFDSRGAPSLPQDRLASQGVVLCLEEGSGIGDYRNAKGEWVLGGYRFLPAPGLGLVVEVPRAEAFAAVYRLRDRILLISLAAAGLMTALGVALALKVSRPLRALIAGARAVAKGDLSHEIPVRSGDELGYLTRVFNRMTSSLRETHAELERLSTTDELTGLYNRRQLAVVFARELSRADRSQESLSLLMIDLDHFKAFNDRHGHLEGDACLREIADFLRAQLRPTDVVVRFGGEEFLALLPATNKVAAAVIGERMRKSFAERDYAVANGVTPLTISVGVAAWPQDGRTEEELIRAADTALYAAKADGRNQVVLFSRATEPGAQQSRL